MKRLFSIAAAMLIASSLSSMPANAQFASWGINSSQAALQARVNAGFRSGALTRSEFNSLQGKLNNIASLEARLRASGNRLSFSERNRLNQRLAKMSVDIQRQMSDAERRFGNRYHHWNWNRR